MKEPCHESCRGSRSIQRRSRRLVLVTATARPGVRRATSAPNSSARRRSDGDRHRACADGAPRRSRAQLCVPGGRGGPAPPPTRRRGARLRPRAVGGRRLMARRGAQARPLSTEPLPPGRLQTDQPGTPRHGRGHRPGGHHGHRRRVRDRTRRKALRRPSSCPHRPTPPV
jgi:hypothetical protein